MVISEFVEDVVIAGDEKKAPPYMEQLQKVHCIVYIYNGIKFQHL